MVTRTITHTGPTDKLYTADGKVYYWSFFDKALVMANIGAPAQVVVSRQETTITVTFTFADTAAMDEYDTRAVPAFALAALPGQTVEEYRTAHGITRVVVVS